MTLLTGLAEGADRLVAECALDHGWSVGAVLALPESEFELDFKANEKSLAQFRTLLPRCASVHVASAPGTPRPDCYAAVGEWVCQHTFALIALWDGDTASAARPGGTAWVVQRFQEIHTTGTTKGPSSPSANGRVGLIHIQVRRALAYPAALAGS